ncbi:MAG TPA: hypothetical protein VLT57_10495 [Bryobacteraceae bacterium]|jgi:hypothetical protein|nr:hypothetical protein [Bryobacteraceae bacterium]
MQSHVKLLGILHIVWGGISVLLGLVALMILGGIGGIAGFANHSDEGAIAFPILALIGVLVFAVVLIISLPGLICGFGLLAYHPWARILCIVVSAMELLSMPFGTALGIYGLWVLLKPETEVLFRRS